MSDEEVKGMKLRVQSVLYGNEPGRIRQAVEHLNRAADFAIAAGVFTEVRMVYGDCSPDPALEPEFVAELEKSSYALSEFEHRFFDQNLGSALGHNRLLQEEDDADYVLIMNPDIMMAPTALLELMVPFASKGVGMVEAKQIPIEHPKVYDPRTGATSWAATACAMIPAAVFNEIGGFDHETFFLYGDDVDFSWRVWLSGRSVIYRPSALAYHDKRLGAGGKWVPGEMEKYYSAEAALLLAYKYSRVDMVDRIINDFEAAEAEHFAKVLVNYRRREQEGRLPAQIDSNHKVAKFIAGAYAEHRFVM